MKFNILFENIAYEINISQLNHILKTLFLNIASIFLGEEGKEAQGEGEEVEKAGSSKVNLVIIIAILCLVSNSL